MHTPPHPSNQYTPPHPNREFSSFQCNQSQLYFALLVFGSRRFGGSSLGIRAGNLSGRSRQND